MSPFSIRLVSVQCPFKIYLNNMQSIIHFVANLSIGLFYFINLPVILPEREPAPAPAILPALEVAWFTFLP